MIDIPKPKVQGFVIYNPEKKLFSSGGFAVKWKKTPKIWADIGRLKNHLHGAIGGIAEFERYTKEANKTYKVNGCYIGCEIYDITTNEVYPFDIYGFIRAKFDESYYGRNGYKFVIDDGIRYGDKPDEI